MYRGRPGGQGVGGGPPYMGHESLEDQNNANEEELKGKIGALKSLSIDIGAEVREHNKLLRDLDDGFDANASLLQQSMSKVLRMAKSGSRYHMLYLFLFCLFVFMVLWYFI